MHGVRQTGFLQFKQNSRASRVSKVSALFAGVAQSRVHSKRMDLLLYMARSKLRVLARSKQQPSFGNITGMVDDMISLEGEEQENDNHQKPWCNGEFEKESREESHEKSEVP